jgi:hypothetical protein
LALCADLSLVFVVFLVVAWTVTWVLNVFRSLKPLPDPTAAIVFVSFAHRRGQKAGAKNHLTLADPSAKVRMRAARASTSRLLTGKEQGNANIHLAEHANT